MIKVQWSEPEEAEHLTQPAVMKTRPGRQRIMVWPANWSRLRRLWWRIKHGVWS